MDLTQYNTRDLPFLLYHVSLKTGSRNEEHLDWGHSLSLPGHEHHKGQATSTRPLCGHCGPLGSKVMKGSIRAWRALLNLTRCMQGKLSTLGAKAQVSPYLLNEHFERTLIEKIFYQSSCPLLRNLLCHSHGYNDLIPLAIDDWVGVGT